MPCQFARLSQFHELHSAFGAPFVNIAKIGCVHFPWLMVYEYIQPEPEKENRKGASIPAMLRIKVVFIYKLSIPL